MLEKLVPSGYHDSWKGMFNTHGFMSSSKSRYDNDVSSYKMRSSSDEDTSSSDDEASPGRTAFDDAYSESTTGDATSYSLMPGHSGTSSSFAVDASSSILDSNDEDSNEEDEYDDEDDDNAFATDDFDDEEGFDSIKGLNLASKQSFKEFRRNFSSDDVPETELLYKAYSCALSKELLYHGRMFVTTHYVCFISKFFNVATSKLVLPFTTITKIEPKSMMNFIPNAISIQTNDDKKYLFASFANRNRTMAFLRKLRNSRLIGSGFTAQSTSAGHEQGQGRSLPSINSNYNNSNSTPLKPLPSRIRSSTLPAEAFDAGQEPTTNPDSNQSGLANNNHLASVKTENSPSIRPRPVTPRSLSAMPDYRSGSRSPSRSVSGAGTNGGANGGANGGGDNTSGSAPNSPQDWPVSNLGPEKHARTPLPKPEENEKVLVTETIAAPVGVVANTLFGNDTSWYKHFLTATEGNKELKELPAFSELKADSERSFEYIKPLSGPVGPKQTKCNCTEKIEKWNFDEYIEVITTTATPDVPSGNSFTTLTRAVLAWGDNNTTQLRLGTWLEWTGKSWLKGPIEKGAIDGQTSYCNALVTELSKKLQGGQKHAATEDAPLKPATTDIEKDAGSKQKASKKSSTAKKAAQAIKEWQQLCSILIAALVVLIFVLIFVTWRSRGPSQPSKEQQYDLQRIQQELELWQWIDDRKGVQVNQHKTLTDANIEEAIAVTEKKLANLKAALC